MLTPLASPESAVVAAESEITGKLRNGVRYQSMYQLNSFNG